MDKVEGWRAAAVEDAARRGLDDLRPLLESLARSTATLRAAPWNERVLPRVEGHSGPGTPSARTEG